MWPTEQNRRAWEERFSPRRDSSDRLPQAVRERLPDVRGKHVLYFPCGSGQIAAELGAMGALVTGVGSDETSLAEARERAPDAAFFQAELDELPLQFRRSRFNLVYAGEGTLSGVRVLEAFLSAVNAALRKSGKLILYDWHPVALCVDPIGLRWRESYFEEGSWSLGQIVIAVVETGLTLGALEELSPPPAESGGRFDPRMPTRFLLGATKTEATPRRSA